jgi:hypothetical protein
LFHRIDAAQAQVVGGHVGDHPHVAAVEAEARAEQAAPGAFEHGKFHVGLLEDDLRAERTGIVAGFQQVFVEVNAVRWW